MTEVEFIEKFRVDKPMLQAYSEYMTELLHDKIVETAKVNPKLFFKVPLKFRIKDEESLIQKAFYRNKNYVDPYNEITDKLGGRIVVLLEDEANIVCQIIESLTEFSFSKDRDFEMERNINPEIFNYKSHHYVLINKSEIQLSHLVPEGTTMELQVRTLLQHAYSELTHDTIYKPNTIASPEVRRLVAKSMALIEVTDQLFSQVNTTLKRSENQFNKIIEETKLLLPPEIRYESDIDLSNSILDAYLTEVEIYDFLLLKRFVKEFDFVFEKIKERSKYKLLYKQSIILFVYFLVYTKRKVTKMKWPLNSKELEQIFTDLGYSYDRS